MTWSEPVFNEQCELTGVRFRLRETQGRGGELKIRSAITLDTCIRTNFNNTFLADEQANAEMATVHFTSFAYFQIQLNFAQ